MIDNKAMHGRFAEASREIVVFFVDNGLVGSRDPIWLQSTLDVLVILFETIGLRTNPDKTKVMTCVPWNIRVAHTVEVYHMQQYGPVNPTAKHHWVEYNICGMSLAAGSLRSHLEMKHNTYCLFVLNQELTVEREAVIYRATTDATGTYFCPVPACVGVVGSECFKITLSLTSSPGSGCLPNRRVPSPAAMQQMWIADLIYGHE
jgi:hypothetical protein